MAEEFILRGPDASTEIPDFRKNVSIIEILHKCMKKNGESIAQIEGDTGKTITFSGLLKESTVIAANLKKLGITEGDVVVVCLDKCILAYSALSAVIFTGATAALWGTFFSEDELQRQNNLCKPKIVFCTKEIYEKMPLSEDSQSPIYVLPDGTSPQLNCNILTEDNNQDFTFYQVKDIDNHCPLILFTSGTTGPSKPVLIPNVTLQRYGFSFLVSDRSIHKFLVVAPFCWLTSQAIFITSVMSNFTMIFSCPDPVLHLQRAQHFQTDTWMITPAFMHTILNEPSLPTYDLSSVKTLVTGGVPLTEHLKKTYLENVFQQGAIILHLYGSTELGCISLFTGLDTKTINNTSSAGKLQSGVQLKVVTENGQTVGPGVQGEIRLKTESMMAKYYGLPRETSRAFDSEGWFCTGDVGYYDEQGFIYPLGRMSDMVQYKDLRLCMAHVEALLVTHPAVIEAAVAARPHPVDNQHPAAFVIIKPNMQVFPEEIQKFIDDQVDDVYKLRGGVHFVDVIPKLPSGKTLRHILQKKFEN